MNNLNFVNLVGRLTQDVELRTTENGRAFSSNSIAVQRNFKNAAGNYDTDFINVVFSGKTAEFVNEHFNKGDVISVVGSISVTTKDTENGKRTYTNVSVDSVAFVPGTRSSGGGAAQGTAQPAQTAQTAQPANGGFVPNDGGFPGFGGELDDDDDLPF